MEARGKRKGLILDDQQAQIWHDCLTTGQKHFAVFYDKFKSKTFNFVDSIDEDCTHTFLKTFTKKVNEAVSFLRRTIAFGCAIST